MRRLRHYLYCRLRGRNRGFGIHSPLAFSVVTDAVSPRRRYGLYVYRDIREMMRGAEVSMRIWRRVRHRARLAARLAVFFHLTESMVDDSVPEIERDLIKETLRLAGAPHRDTRSAPALAVSGYTPGIATMLASGDLNGSVVLVYATPSQIAALCRTVRDNRTKGILLDGCNALLYIASADPVLTEYKILL